jgi:hypothetical protein
MPASPAMAGGINLAWNDCYGAGGTMNKNFACNTNTGNHDLYISFEPNATIPDLNGSNAIIDLQSASAALPAWWQFKNTGTCRLTSLVANSGVTGTCPDTWSGQGVAGIAAYFTTQNIPAMPTCRARILASISVPGAAAAQVDPGTEYYCLMVRINSAKTVGTGLCAGCLDPACLVLNEVLLTSNNSGDNRLTNWLGSNYVTWQGGWCHYNWYGCTTPTINRTWGQLKGLYR